MASRRKTWAEKYATTKEPKVVELEAPFGGAPAGAKMLVSCPAEVEAELRKIPKGDILALADFRKRLAACHGAEVACPTSSSIFVRIVAEVALEQLQAGKSIDEIAPFWRVVDPSSPMAGKLSCGSDWVRAQRDVET